MKILHIKNMVCPRCISAVSSVFKSENIELEGIKLGEVKLKNDLSSNYYEVIGKKLSQQGFQLLEDSKSQTISKIKTIIVQQVHQINEPLKVNFSTLLSQELNQEYTTLSKLFSSVEGLTIERFVVRQKIEKVKELLFYNELTLSEISYLMNYSSSAHLSNQFKKEIGMTPSQFKKMKHPSHKSLDSI